MSKYNFDMQGNRIDHNAEKDVNSVLLNRVKLCEIPATIGVCVLIAAIIVRICGNGFLSSIFIYDCVTGHVRRGWIGIIVNILNPKVLYIFKTNIYK